MNAKKTLKAAGSVAGATVMMGSALMLTPMAALAQGAEALEAPAQQAAGEVEVAAAITESTAPTRVEGTFSYDQSTVTPTAQMADVFAKAAAVLCQGMPQYEVMQPSDVIRVANLSVNEVCEATVEELADQTDVENLIIGCACSTNAAGGGAIANADVQGVTLAAAASLVGAF